MCTRTARRRRAAARTHRPHPRGRLRGDGRPRADRPPVGPRHLPRHLPSRARADRGVEVLTRTHSFRSMGTTVSLIAPADVASRTFDRAARDVERTFAREDQRFSRFRPDSELSLVNASAGRWIPVSARFAAVTRFALAAAGTTRGLFDPTILGALVAAGYDRDFDEVLAGARGRLHPPEPCGRFAEVQLEGSRLRVPAGVALDFGG